MARSFEKLIKLFAKYLHVDSCVSTFDNDYSFGANPDETIYKFIIKDNKAQIINYHNVFPMISHHAGSLDGVNVNQIIARLFTISKVVDIDPNHNLLNNRKFIHRSKIKL